MVGRPQSQTGARFPVSIGKIPAARFNQRRSAPAYPAFGQKEGQPTAAQWSGVGPRTIFSRPWFTDIGRLFISFKRRIAAIPTGVSPLRSRKGQASRIRDAAFFVAGGIP